MNLRFTATGQSYKISVNGKITADCVGNRETSGYIALQTHRNGGGIHFRDIRIKELSTPASLALAVSISKPGESPVETLTQQAPNAMEWALAPLDQAVPGDIRQNLTFLREDLLDEGAKKPKASPEAYTLASKLCDTLLATLQERYLAQGHAEFRNVEANARTGVTSEALEARRSYKMSWPQFAREESQRAELKSQATNNAEVLKELPEKSGSNAPTSAARPLTPSTNNSAKH